MTWDVFYFWWGDESTCDALWHFCQFSKCTWCSHREHHVCVLQGDGRVCPLLSLLPLQQSCSRFTSSESPCGCQWAEVAQRANAAAAAIPQYPIPFTWRGKGWDAAFRVTEIHYAWEPFAAFSNLSEKASLQQLFCNPAKARNAFAEARAAQPCQHSSRQRGQRRKWWKVSKKLTLLWSPVIPSPALFEPQTHTAFPR